MPAGLKESGAVWMVRLWVMVTDTETRRSRLQPLRAASIAQQPAGDRPARRLPPCLCRRTSPQSAAQRRQGQHYSGLYGRRQMARLSRYLARLFWSEAMALFAVAAFLLF